MAKVDGPLFSFSASGSIADTITFSKWKGRPYVRQRVIPSNPQTVLQVSVRAMMKYVSQQWAELSAGNQATWQTQADQITASTFNAYTKFNLAEWTKFLPPTQEANPGRLDSLPTTPSFTVVAGVGQVTVLPTQITPNDVWGYLIFRSPTASFTTGRDNLIGVLADNLAHDAEYVDTPLAAGTYYYDVRPFTKDGRMGAEIGEETAVVT